VREHKSKVVGKKIAATSAMAQESVSVHEPFHGNLFSHSTFASGISISIGDITLGLQKGFLLIEPELAVQMNADTEPSMVYTPETIRGLIGGIIPSVEIATSAFFMSDLEAFKKLGAPTLIADNACHGALVLGNAVTSSSGDAPDIRNIVDRLDEQTCTLRLNGNDVAHGEGKQVLGHPVNALCWLANALGRRGETLKKGDIVSTGVCVDKLVLVESGDYVSVDYGKFGQVTFNLVD
jgi:2-keto-4-pentenoate hydratase